MRTVEMPEAAAHLPELLDEVEHGGEITILRGGKPIARLMPSQPSTEFVVTAEQRARAHEAIEDMNKLRAELKLGPFDWEEYKADRDSGRK
jgi:prevent-host-death family protein